MYSVYFLRPENSFTISNGSGSYSYDLVSNEAYAMVNDGMGELFWIEHLIFPSSGSEEETFYHVSIPDDTINISLFDDGNLSVEADSSPLKVSFGSDFFGASSSIPETPTDLFQSLNGNFGTLEDGTAVLVVGQGSKVFTIVSSFVGWDNPDTGGLIINYNLKDENDKIMTVPYILVKAS